MAREAPLVGEKIRFLLLGGNVVSENALLRFYVLHCVVLPVALLLSRGGPHLADPEGRRRPGTPRGRRAPEEVKP